VDTDNEKKSSASSEEFLKNVLMVWLGCGQNFGKLADGLNFNDSWISIIKDTF